MEAYTPTVDNLSLLERINIEKWFLSLCLVQQIRLHLSRLTQLYIYIHTSPVLLTVLHVNRKIAEVEQFQYPEAEQIFYFF